MAGHVFIVRGDIRKLSCDAWLMPCDQRAAPRRQWFPEDYAGPRTGAPFRNGTRVQQLLGWPEDEPTPWLVDVGGFSGRPVEWYVEGVEEFLQAVVKTVPTRPRYGRAKHLFAMPVVGTGGGGAMERAGEVLQALLPVLREHARQLDVDLAIVAFEAASYAAAQAERSRYDDWFEELPSELRLQAKRLAQQAATGNLALFLGAGISMAAGLPGWSNMLQNLAHQANLEPEECKALGQVRSVLDQATILERRFERMGLSLGEAIKHVFSGFKHFALPHALLAALPVREVITTNYDQLFEETWRPNVANDVSILPASIKPHARHWLLKMHGCLSRPDQIVLTRASYTRYEQNLPALSGIVQGFLVTRHMLFVGFSLTDDNFHRIVDAVRRIRRDVPGNTKLGTSISLGYAGMLESLWEHDLHRVTMIDQLMGDSFPFAEATRRVEIFLDCLAMETRSTAHLLVGDRFNAVLTAGERRLRDLLRDFVEQLNLEDASDSIRQTVAWPEIRRMLENLGYFHEIKRP